MLIIRMMFELNHSYTKLSYAACISIFRYLFSFYCAVRSVITSRFFKCNHRSRTLDRKVKYQLSAHALGHVTSVRSRDSTGRRSACRDRRRHGLTTNVIVFDLRWGCMRSTSIDTHCVHAQGTVMCHAVRDVESIFFVGLRLREKYQAPTSTSYTLYIHIYSPILVAHKKINNKRTNKHIQIKSCKT